MKLKMVFVLSAISVLVGISELTAETGTRPTSTLPDAPQNQTAAITAQGHRPLYFIENRGQVHERVRFYSREGGQTTWFSADGIKIDLYDRTDSKQKRLPARFSLTPAETPVNTSSLQMIPAGMSPEVEITALEPQDYRVNYFIGNDPKKWVSDIPTYRGVLYREAYSGIDLKFYGNERRLEYDIIVKPGANPDEVKFRYAGVESLEVTPGGDLAMKLPHGVTLVQKKPVVYQEISGVRIAGEGRFKVYDNTAEHAFGFAVASYDERFPLIIDPVLVYSTYLGGSGDDHGEAVAVDDSGCAYVVGQTQSLNFPTADPIQPAGSTSRVGFVTKLNSAGTGLVYSTYFGGTGQTTASSVAIDGSNNVYVTGFTKSPDFPQYRSIPGQITQATTSGSVFVTEINSQGNTLVYSTLLGGSGFGMGRGIAVGPDRNVYITGNTQSSDYPTTANAYQTSKVGTENAFVTKLGPTAIHVISTKPTPIIKVYPDIIYSTYLGGSSYDCGYGIAVNSKSEACVAGETSSSNFPVYRAINGQGSKPSGSSNTGFVTQFSSDGQHLVFSTYLAGSTETVAGSPAIDKDDNIYVGGCTMSSDYPILNAFQRTLSGNQDGFITKIKPGSATAAASILYSTFLGGGNSDSVTALTVDAGGNAYAAGWTQSSDFPGIPATGWITTGFLAKLGPAGNKLLYSTALGNGIGGVALDGSGNAFLTGYVGSAVLNTKNAYQPSFGGGTDDAFVARIAQDTGVEYLQLLLGSD